MNSHSYFPLCVASLDASQLSLKRSCVDCDGDGDVDGVGNGELRFECCRAVVSLVCSHSHAHTIACLLASSLCRLTLLAESSFRNEANCTQPAAQLLLFSVFGRCLCCWAVLCFVATYTRQVCRLWYVLQRQMVYLYIALGTRVAWLKFALSLPLSTPPSTALAANWQPCSPTHTHTRALSHLHSHSRLRAHRRTDTQTQTQQRLVVAAWIERQSCSALEFFLLLASLKGNKTHCLACSHCTLV